MGEPVEVGLAGGGDEATEVGLKVRLKVWNALVGAIELGAAALVGEVGESPK